MSEVVELLQAIVRIPSTNPAAAAPGEACGEGRLGDFLEGWAAEAGLACVRQPVLPGRDNVLLVWPGSGGPAVLLEAHLDTVGVRGFSGDPFSAEVREGKLWGRGACDCKGSLAAMLVAARRAAREQSPAGVIVAGVVDEEFLFAGIEYLIAHPLPLPVRGAVVGEPTGLDVIPYHGGAVRLVFTFRGRAAHTSYPENGENAIQAALRAAQAFEDYHRRLRAEPGATEVQRSCTVTTIEGGEALNVVPDCCRLGVDRRLWPGERVEAVQAELTALATEAAGERIGVEADPVLLDPPLDQPVDNALTELCREAVTAVRGQCVVRGVNYSTDASNLARGGIPAVVLGPGDIAQAHSIEEWVSVEEVEQAAEAYARIIGGVAET